LLNLAAELNSALCYFNPSSSKVILLVKGLKSITTKYFMEIAKNNLHFVHFVRVLQEGFTSEFDRSVSILLTNFCNSFAKKHHS